MAKIKYLRTHRITAQVLVKTGLRIGAGKDVIEIGGIDNPVIKHPHTQRPYIPGSSVKGKVRSLLEWLLDRVEDDGSVWGTRQEHCEPKDPILRIFGATRKDWTGGPTRLIVRDAVLDEEWERKTLESGLALTEDKMEVTIDRIQGKAAAMGPRTMERVPAGAVFNLEMLFKVYSLDGDDGEADWHCLERLIEGLKLLEQDALGGCGSRGYGRVAIRDLRLDGRPIQEHFDRITQIRKEAPAALARS